MKIGIGKRRGLMECSTSQGVLAILAVDQRGSLRKSMRPDDPESVSYHDLVKFKRQVISMVAPETSAVLLDPEFGAAQNIISDTIPGSTGLIVSLEETGYTGDSHARKSTLLPDWTVEKAQRLGASGVKLLIYYHPRSVHAERQREIVAEVAEECKQHDVAFFLEPLIHSIEPGMPKLPPSERREVIVQMAQELSTFGADILKLEFPLDVQAQPDESLWVEACQEVTEASQVPWVLLSAGVNFDIYLGQVVAACSGGATGVMAGRAVWKEAVALGAIERENFLQKTAIPRFIKLRSICDGLATPWRSYYSTDEITEDWYRE